MLIYKESVGVRAAFEQLACKPGVCEARVRDVDERRPAPRSLGLVRIAVPASAENEPRPGIALDPGMSREQRFGARPVPVGRRDDEGDRLVYDGASASSVTSAPDPSDAEPP